jgi:glycerol-3-phosphate dehydrogenase (NAD(P)+)
MWTPNTASAAEMLTDRVNNHYLPGQIFPGSLHPTSNIKEALQDADVILIAVPSAAFREVLTLIQPLISTSIPIIWATKGLDNLKGQFLHETAEEILGKTRSYAVLSGPSFAREVAIGLPTAAVIASIDSSFANELLNYFNSSHFRIYLSTDVIGVEIGGVVKNVLAIATGIADGMKLGANARSALITRGLAEMTRLGLALGGQYETFTGLAGLGDLVLTCTDNQSRNRRFGLALGEGKKTDIAEKEIGQVVEGKLNAEQILQLAQKVSVEMPITEAVCEILRGKASPKEAMQHLLSRSPKTEH